MRVFYGAGHEQFTPRDLLCHAQRAEDAGFDGISCSDHFQPWWPDGESGHAWPWLRAGGASTRRGALGTAGTPGRGGGPAGASTSRVAIGTAVTPAVARYHPAIVAQAWATLEQMFPGRVFL